MLAGWHAPQSRLLPTSIQYNSIPRYTDFATVTPLFHRHHFTYRCRPPVRLRRLSATFLSYISIFFLPLKYKRLPLPAIRFWRTASRCYRFSWQRQQPNSSTVQPPFLPGYFPVSVSDSTTLLCGYGTCPLYFWWNLCCFGTVFCGSTSLPSSLASSGASSAYSAA